MRLYCQPGLSSRVVQALRTRLERTLKMAEEGRARSRSPVREAAESETPGVPEAAQGMPEGSLGDMAAVPGMPEGAPSDMTAAPSLAPAGMETLTLAQKLSECTMKIGKVIEDLGLAFDELNNGRLELKKGFQELSTQIKGTNHCNHHYDSRGGIPSWGSHQTPEGL